MSRSTSTVESYALRADPGAMLFRIRKYGTAKISCPNVSASRLISKARIAKELKEYADAASERRHIFVASSGRAGSGYVAALAALMHGCFGVHEPRPRMNASILRRVERRGLAATYCERLFKAHSVAGMAAKLGADAYIESSHMFVKTWWDVAIDNLPNVTVIALRRRLRDVVSSFLQMGYFCRGTPHWRLWFPRPNALSRIVDPRAVTALTHVERIVVYLLEIEVLTAALDRRLQQTRGTKVINCTLDGLASEKGVKEFSLIAGTPLREDWGARFATLPRNDRATAKTHFAGEKLDKSRIAEEIATFIGSGRIDTSGVDLSLVRV